MRSYKLLLPVMLLTLLICLCGCSQSGSAQYDEGMKALEKGELETAASCFAVGISTGEHLAENYRGLGITNLEQGDYEQAISNLSRSLTQDEELTDEFIIDVYYYLADAYNNRGELIKAIEAYTSLLNYTHRAEVYYKRGKIYLEKRDTERARADFEKAVNLDGGYAISWQVYRECSMAGQEKMGRAFLSEAMERVEGVEGNTIEECYYPGLFSYTLGYNDNAKEYLTKAAKLGSKEAQLVLGQVYLAMNDEASARSLYQEYLQGEPGSSQAYNGLALCDMASGEYAAALDNIQKGLACGEEDALQSLQYNRVVAYEKLHDYDNARAYLEQYMKAFPEDEEASREYVFLKNR